MFAQWGCAVMILVGCLCGYIFVLESFLWMRESTMRVFSVSGTDEAESTREMAFNQGFYNLFIGLMALGGSIAYLSGSFTVGMTLMLAAAASMSAAAIVLFVSSPDKRGAAVKQLVLPLAGGVLLLLSIL